MKKLILLSIAILGLANITNAWVKTPPQIWKEGALGGSNVICYDTEAGFCMSGDGSSPYNGQSCLIWTSDGRYICPGRVLSSNPSPESSNNENTAVEAETATDINNNPG